MSVVTRWRRTFSSSTSHFSLMPGFSSNLDEYFCITTMSGLFTVATVNVVWADAEPATARNAGAESRFFSVMSSSWAYWFQLDSPPHGTEASRRAPVHVAGRDQGRG